MVQAISLDKLTPQKLDKVDSKDVKLSNTDFLELLLKDMDDTLSKDDKSGLNDLKDNKKVDEKLLKDEDEKLDFKLEPKFQLLNTNNNVSKDENLKEIKNIITSKFKQENIILSKQDEKEFKKIDNLKDLIKFSDKKGLNIENLKLDIQKEIKETPKFQNSTNKLGIDTKTTKEILDKLPKKENKITKIDNHTSNDKKISLENILNSSKKTSNDKKVDLNKNTHKIEKKDLKNIDNKTHTINTSKSNPTLTTEVNKTNKLDLNTLLETKNEAKKSDKIVHKLPETKIEKKDLKIDSLESLLNPKDKVETKKVQTKDSLDVNINQQNMVNEIKAKGVQAKETINHFKNNLDEAIKNYKPPVSKVDIELNPKNLGKVEVTIIQRGNNIQVNMNTDQNNMQLFQTHQAEFRQALSNIGFSNIDMSFNSNQDRDRRQNQAKKTYKENEFIDDIAEIEIKADYKYA